ncbi:MAG: hypothetical protein IIW61_00110, partial [Bacteroidaceae bacterium]|nr:hypothetical protein [Bacteroidaceae bacterium]
MVMKRGVLLKSKGCIPSMKSMRIVSSWLILHNSALALRKILQALWKILQALQKFLQALRKNAESPCEFGPLLCGQQSGATKKRNAECEIRNRIPILCIFAPS